MSTLAEEFAEIQIVELDEVVSELDAAAGEVTTVGNQQAFSSFISEAIVAIQEDDIETAIDKLEKALARTDGCVLRGAPDGNGPGRDWITDCTAQAEAYDLLQAALDALDS